jgi:hypothetical protein
MRYRHCVQSEDADSSCICLTPHSKILPGKLTVSQLVKGFSKFYLTRRFVTLLTRASHQSLTQVKSFQPKTFQQIHLRSISSPSTTCSCNCSVSFMSSDQNAPASYMPCHHILLGFITQYLLSSTTREAPHYVVLSILLSLPIMSTYSNQQLVLKTPNTVPDFQHELNTWWQQLSPSAELSTQAVHPKNPADDPDTDLRIVPY